MLLRRTWRQIEDNVKTELSDEEIDRRIEKFRKVVRYRKITGMVLAAVGLIVLLIGLRTEGGVFLTINGAFCMGYGLFMRWQAVRYEKKF
tara:strand:- start:225 stop:494 length:270 start_codon:yes stop_codon:yes gene_type:complete